MIDRISKYSLLLFITLFFFFVLIGYFFLSGNFTETNSFNTLKISLNEYDLFKIITNNLLIGILILFGFLTFNLTNISFLVFNGLLYGIAINKYSVEFGLFKTLLAIAPHGIIEYIGLGVLFSCSLEINISLYQYFNKNNNTPIKLKTIKKILLGFIIIIFSSLIEVYLTPLIL